MALEKLIRRELSGLSKAWRKAKPQQGYVRPEDGDYVARLISMKIDKAQGGKGRLQCVSTFKILDGEAKGMEVSRYDGLEKDQLGFFRSHCEVLGIEWLDDPIEMAESLEEFVDNNESLFNIQLRTKGEYQNLYVKGESEYVEESEDEEEEEEEEKPKKKGKKQEEDEDEEEEEDEDENEDEDEEEDDDEEEEEDEDEEEEEPKKKGKGKKK